MAERLHPRADLQGSPRRPRFRGPLRDPAQRPAHAPAGAAGSPAPPRDRLGRAGTVRRARAPRHRLARGRDPAGRVRVRRHLPPEGRVLAPRRGAARPAGQAARLRSQRRGLAPPLGLVRPGTDPGDPADRRRGHLRQPDLARFRPPAEPQRLPRARSAPGGALRRPPGGAGSRGEKVVLGWVGSPGTAYNLFAAWEALERLFARHPGIELRLPGDRPRSRARRRSRRCASPRCPSTLRRR